MRAGFYQLIVLPILWLVFTPVLLTVIFGTLVLWPAGQVASKPDANLPQRQIGSIGNQTQPALNFTEAVASPPATPAKLEPTLSYHVATTTAGTATIEVSANSPITNCSLQLTGSSYDQTIAQPAAADSSGCSFVTNNLTPGNYQFEVVATKLGGGAAKSFGGFTVF